MPAANDSAVARAAFENLGLNQGVESVSPGHDADIVFFSDGDKISNPAEIPQNHLAGAGKQLRLGKFLPVIHDHAGKAHMRKNRYQFLGHMAAAEDVHLSGAVQLFDVKLPAIDLDTLGVAGEIFSQFWGGFVRQTEPAAFGQITYQPESLIFGKAGFRIFRQSQNLPVSGWKIMKVHGDIPAADHPQILDIVFGQGKLVVPGLAFRQYLPGNLLRTVFHSAAADGTGDPALGSHQHPCPGSPGRGAGGGHDRDQNQVFSLQQMGFHGVEHGTHTINPPVVERLTRSRTEE